MKATAHFLLGFVVSLLLALQATATDQDLLREKAESGDAEAQFNLGVRYDNGIGVQEDNAEAVKWYRKAADQGHAGAQDALGHSYRKGRGVQKDEAEAVKWYRKAADQGNAGAQLNLGVFYEYGQGVPKDEVEAVKWYRKAADQGDAYAQYSLGVCYDFGQGVPKDEAEAVKWYRKAADKRLAEAQFILGVCYEYGQGVPKDEAEAVKWYRKAADQRHGGAYFSLGGSYAPGLFFANPLGAQYPHHESVAEAVKWYRRAAEQGHASAQFNLGVCYEYGQGVPKDAAEAVKWYRKAADQGHAGAQFNLGLCYDYGLGVPKDGAETVKWFRKAAEQGHARAQGLLGFCYGAGEGVPKDDIEAYKWYLLAGAQGDAIAKHNMSILERQLAPAQRAEGQRLAREFTPRTGSAAESSRSGGTIAEGPPQSTGTGFFITTDGYLITNEHVVSEAGSVRVVTSEGMIPARIIKVDRANDLALLKVEGGFNPSPVAASRTVRLGSTVATVGFPNVGLQGFSPKLAKGEIASLSGAQDDARHFQISVPVQPGNSGGALFDERGNVIGVIVAKLSQEAALATSGTLAENVNYAIKSSFLLGFLESVPEVAAKLEEPRSAARKFEDVVKDAENSSVLVLVY